MDDGAAVVGKRQDAVGDVGLEIVVGECDGLCDGFRGDEAAAE